MFCSLLTLTFAIGANPQPTFPTPPKVEMPKLMDGPAPIKPLYAPAPRTIQLEPPTPSNPFLGMRTGDFATVRGARSLPETTGPVARFPVCVDHATELFDKLYMNTRIAHDVNAAIEDDSGQLPLGRFETRKVWAF